MKKTRINKIKPTGSDRVVFAVSYVLTTLFALVCVYPLIYVISMSLSSDNAVMSNSVWLLPKGLNLESYKTALSKPELLEAIKNSVIYTVVGTALSVFLTFSFGFSLSRKNTWFNGFLQTYATICMIFSGGLIPTFIVVTKLGLFDSMWAVIFSGTLSIWNAILVRVFIKTNISESLFEAARIDGANDLQQFFKLVLPLSPTIIAIIALYAAVDYWNGYLEALIYLSTKTKWPLQVYLRNVLEDTSGYLTVSLQGDELFAFMASRNRIKFVTIVISTIPVIVSYPFLQKFFVQGIMIGAIKE